MIQPTVNRSPFASVSIHRASALDQSAATSRWP